MSSSHWHHQFDQLSEGAFQTVIGGDISNCSAEAPTTNLPDTRVGSISDSAVPASGFAMSAARLSEYGQTFDGSRLEAVLIGFNRLGQLAGDQHIAACSRAETRTVRRQRRADRPTNLTSP